MTGHLCDSLAEERKPTGRFHLDLTRFGVASPLARFPHKLSTDP